MRGYLQCYLSLRNLTVTKHHRIWCWSRTTVGVGWVYAWTACRWIYAYVDWSIHAEIRHLRWCTAYQHYCHFSDAKNDSLSMPALGLAVLDNPFSLPWRYFVGNLGMTGQTAYYALKDVSEPKPASVYFMIVLGAKTNGVIRGRPFLFQPPLGRSVCESTPCTTLDILLTM